MKGFWKNSIVGFILKNILAAAVLVAIGVWVTFRAIDKYTEHGVAEKVPDLRGAYMAEAEVLLAAQELYPQIIDSVYMRDKRLGTIVDQTPLPGSTIKHHRPVYLVINSREVRKVALPAVNDFSSRQANSMLTASGLQVESIEYVPSEYRDLVIDVKYQGESVTPGTPIPEGDSVTLVVGRGTGLEKVVVPKLKGLTLDEARMALVSASLITGGLNRDATTAEGDSLCFVYRQEPVDGNIVPSGTKIDLWLTADTLLLKQTPQPATYTNSQDEEFF